MATSEKIVKLNLTTIPSTLYTNGGSYKGPTTNALRSVKSVAERHRRRPAWPDVTPFTLTDHWENPGTFDDRDGSGRWGTIGSAQLMRFKKWTYVNDDGTAALTRALNKLTRDRGGFGESLAEATQTLNLLKGNLTRIVRFSQALKRGDIRAAIRVLDFDPGPKATARIKAAKWSRRVSDEYLAFSFGLMPIIEESVNVAKLYENGLQKRGQSIKVRSGARNHAYDQYPTDLGRATYSGRVTNEYLRFANSYGLLNIPQEIWNHVPLSFVFDWFIPVGTYLGAITGSAGITGEASVTAANGYYRRVQGEYHPGWDILHARDIVYTRRRSDATVSPAVLERSSALSFGKLVSLAALSRQQLFGR